MAVPEPPTDPAAVARVAEQRVAYCNDIVTQGLETATLWPRSRSTATAGSSGGTERQRIEALTERMDALGTWDAGPYDNDDAADFTNGLDDAPENQRVAMIRAALATAVENDAYLDLDEGAPAVAAAALVAFRLPDGEQFAPNTYGPQAPIPDLPPDLIPLAISAIERILGENSELASLWSEDMRAHRPWHTSMRQLKSVLLSGATDGMDPLFEVAP